MEGHKTQIIVERCEDGKIDIHTNFDCDEILFLDDNADEYNTEQDVIEEYENINKLKYSKEFTQKSSFYW